MKSVDYSSCGKLSCGPCGGAVILCLDEAKTASGYGFIDATLVTIDSDCHGVYTYGFTYEEAQLLDPNTDLVEADILGILCKGCLTTYIEGMIIKYFTEHSLPPT